MILVLTMAGLYQRFANEGYKLPKYLLPWGDKTVLSAILTELQRDRGFSDVFFVANHRDENYMPHVKAIMRLHEIPAEHLVLTHDTKGQAATAMVGVAAIESSSVRQDQPVAFHNIDTILYKRNVEEMARSLTQDDGYIDVFTSHNSGYSYVLTDEKRKVIEIAEKIVVSDLATSGLYGFKSVKTVADNYDAAQDIYISAIYKRMIGKGLAIRCGDKHHESDTVVLGTPVEYMNAALVAL
ncbi:MAG: sugar phosphate nucleotidyltransferase [Kofleriaceae bacterium]